MSTRTITDSFGRQISVTVDVETGGALISWDGCALRLDRDPGDGAILARAATHFPAGVSPTIVTSHRDERAEAYFQALRVEETDDRVTVIGDTIDKLVAQVETIRVATRSPATPAWADLIAKLQAVKDSIPARPLPRPVTR